MDIFVAALAGVVVMYVLRAPLQRRRQRLVEAGHDVPLPAKLRLPDRHGLAGRWRDGVVVVEGDRLTFRPRRPRRGARFDLTGSRVVGRRPRGRFDFWWFAGPTVLELEGPAPVGRFEVGAATDGDIDLLAARFGC